MQISLKLIQAINHAKSTVCMKFQLLVTFISLFTAPSSLSVFPPSVLYHQKQRSRKRHYLYCVLYRGGISKNSEFYFIFSWDKNEKSFFIEMDHFCCMDLWNLKSVNRWKQISANKPRIKTWTALFLYFRLAHPGWPLTHLST